MKRSGQYNSKKALSAVMLNCPACPGDELKEADIMYDRLLTLVSHLCRDLYIQVEASSLENGQHEGR